VAGAAVDMTHAVSMAVLAAADRPLRRAICTDTVVETAFALAGLVSS
jgi:hypothetical protein